MFLPGTKATKPASNSSQILRDCYEDCRSLLACADWSVLACPEGLRGMVGGAWIRVVGSGDSVRLKVMI